MSGVSATVMVGSLILAVLWPWTCGLLQPRRGREAKFNEEWARREHRRRRRRQRRREWKEGDGSIAIRMTAFRPTLSLADQPVNNHGESKATDEEATIMESSRATIAPAAAIVGGKDDEEADVLEASRHTDMYFDDLVGLVHKTKDTLFPFSRRVVDEIFRLVDTKGSGAITAAQIVAVAAAPEQGLVNGSGVSPSEEESSLVAARAIVERSQNPPLIGLFLGHASNEPHEMGKKTLQLLLPWRHNRRERGGDGAVPPISDEEERRAKQEKLDAEVRRVESFIATDILETTKKDEKNDDDAEGPEVAAVTREALHEWMARKRAQRLAWLKVSLLIANTRYFGKGLDPRPSDALDEYGGHHHEEEEEEEGVRAAHGRRERRKEHCMAGLVRWVEEQCGRGWLADYLYFVKNYHPLAACLAASSLHPRSRFELFQILCIDVNLCILLTAVSLRYQLLRRYDDRWDEQWTALWSTLVMVTLPQVAVQRFVGTLGCDFMLEDLSSQHRVTAPRVIDDAGRHEACLCLGRCLQWWQGVKQRARQCCKASAERAGASVITSVFFISFALGTWGVGFMLAPPLVGENTAQSTALNVLYGYATALVFSAAQQYNPSRRLHRFIRFATAASATATAAATEQVDGHKSSAACDRRPPCCGCSRDCSCCGGACCCGRRCSVRRCVEGAARLLFKVVVVDFLGVCSWQREREKTLGIIRAKIQERGRGDFSHPFALPPPTLLPPVLPPPPPPPQRRTSPEGSAAREGAVESSLEKPQGILQGWVLPRRWGVGSARSKAERTKEAELAWTTNAMRSERPPSPPLSSPPSSFSSPASRLSSPP